MARRQRTNAGDKIEVRVPGLPAPVEVTERVLSLIAEGAPVAFGVSGGKDSCAVTLAGTALLDYLGHDGPRVLAHADLGMVEWDDSLATCHRLAAATGLELLEARREKGGMMERWEQRWDDNARRYRDLRCVALILPFSSNKMRFCTKELKISPIGKLLAGRYPGRVILSASGIRRSESRDRAHAPTVESFPEAERKRTRTRAWRWNPIAGWSKADVLALAARHGFRLHDGYALGMSRISCRFCVLANQNDLRVSASVPAHRELYRRTVRLEIRSTFSFQSGHWLGDVAPHLLEPEERSALAEAKVRAQKREVAEAAIPGHLSYTRGWPLCAPTAAEARLLADIRQTVARVVQIPVEYTDADSILARYHALLEMNRRRKTPIRRTPPVTAGLEDQWPLAL